MAWVEKQKDGEVFYVNESKRVISRLSGDEWEALQEEENLSQDWFAFKDMNGETYYKNRKSHLHVRDHPDKTEKNLLVSKTCFATGLEKHSHCMDEIDDTRAWEIFKFGGGTIFYEEDPIPHLVTKIQNGDIDSTFLRDGKFLDAEFEFDVYHKHGPNKQLKWVELYGSLPPVMDSDDEWKYWRRNEDAYLFGDSVDATDIRQGDTLGDCYLMGYFAAIAARYPDIVHSMFNYNPEFGCYSVKFDLITTAKYIDCLFDRKPKYMLLDNLTPTLGGKHRFCKSVDPKELWPVFLEKAYAKWAGGYQNLDGYGGRLRLCCGHSWMDPTPLKAITFAKKTWSKRWNRQEDPDALWHQFFQRHNTGWILSLTSANFRVDCLPNQGLAAFHAYTLLDMVETVLDDGKTFQEWVEGQDTSKIRNSYAYKYWSEDDWSNDKQASELRLVKLRNTWGCDGEWNGVWSDTCSSWEYFPEVKKRCEHTAGNDGQFWMQWADFVQCFKGVDGAGGIPAPPSKGNRVSTDPAHSKTKLKTAEVYQCAEEYAMDEEEAKALASLLDLRWGGTGDYRNKGMYAYDGGDYAGKAYWGTGGSKEENFAPIFGIEDAYRPKQYALDEGEARQLAAHLGFSWGGTGNYRNKGMYAYKAGKYGGKAYWGTGGDRSALRVPLFGIEGAHRPRRTDGGAYEEGKKTLVDYFYFDPDVYDKDGVVDLFKEWDTNGDGIISKNELASVFAECGAGFTDAELDAMMQAVDTNHDGTVRFEELLAWVWEPGEEG